jgi:HlyD family secretion protein
MRTFIVASVLAIFGVGALAGCGHPAPPPQHAAARVPVFTAEPGVVSPSSTLGGIIVPYQNVAIQSNLSEPAVSVLVREGDRVHRGEVLAILDTSDLRGNLQSAVGTAASAQSKAQQTLAQAGLTIAQNQNSTGAARAAVIQVEATLQNDQRDLRRDETLLRQGYIPQQTYDRQRTLVENDVQAVRTAQVALQNAQTQVSANGTTSTGMQGATVAAARADQQTALGQAAQIRAQIAKATIVSPVDGIVVNRNFNPGEYPGSRQIFTIQETDQVYAVLNGSGAQVIGIRTGAQAQISSSDAPIRARGAVVAVLDEATPGSTNFVVKVRLANPQHTLRSGMVVSGHISKPTAFGIRVPIAAFLDDTHSSVQVVQNDVVGTVRVHTGVEDDAYAVVAGLSAGAQVVANGQTGLADGQTVAPQRVALR